MSEHPIEGLMKTAMESIKEMVDVSTVVGDAVETPDGTVIIPISRVTCGFAAGGSEFKNEGKSSEEKGLPFGGGTGAGIALNPVAFLVVGQETVRLLPVSQNAIYDRLIDAVPGFIDQLQGMVKGERSSNGVLRPTYKI